MQFSFKSGKNKGYFNFEVRHLRCVSQITKLYSRRLKSKHNYIILYIQYKYQQDAAL